MKWDWGKLQNIQKKGGKKKKRLSKSIKLKEVLRGLPFGRKFVSTTIEEKIREKY